MSIWPEFVACQSPDYQVFEDIKYVENSTDPYQILNLSIPKKQKGFATVIWLHGGGMVADHPESPVGLYEGTRAVVEVRYRLSPDCPVPGPIHDAAASLAWVFKHIGEYGGDTGKIFFGGLSAGAFLAAISALAPEYLEPYGLSYRDLKGLFLVSGQMTTHFQLKKDLNYPGDNLLPVIDKYAPLNYLSKDLPPVLMITGQHDLDIPGRASENQLMADTLNAMGHSHVECYSLNGHGHGHHLSDYHIINNFFNKVLQA